MPRNATKAADNVFYLARKAAEKCNDHLGSREGAAEETGIDRTRLARIEAGVLIPYPEEVLMMAHAYQAPQLCNHFCASLCPLGKKTIPPCELLQIDRLALKVMSAMQGASGVQQIILEIAGDGQITGWRQPITISKRSGFITKGHGRLMAAQRKGWKQVPADFQEYATEAEEWSDLIADNRLAELSTIDNERLVDLIREIGDDVPLELTGFCDEDINDIIAALEKANEAAEEIEDDQADAAAEEDGPVATQAGDIWHLGAHRLICGDATDEATVERLMQGEKAELVNTDPPYGVSYISSSGRFDDGIMNDTLTGDDLLNTLLIPAFRNYVKHTSDEAAFYIWHASSTRRDFDDALTAAGLVEKQYIIWVKNSFVLGHADYHWNHEPCFYAEKAGHTAHWYGDRTQSTTWKATIRDEDGAATTLSGGIVITDGEGNKLYLTSEPPKGKKIRRIRLQKGRSVYLFQPDGKTTDTWEVTKDAHVDHPTQKPVELAIRAINNNTKPGDLVIDFFGGSGSTLRAAEMTGRRCYTLELDPRYCDLIVKGYIALTGDESVVCERDGERIACTDLLDLDA